MIQVSCCFFIFNFCQPPGTGAFSGDFTINLAWQCRAFGRALKIEKLKAPLFCGPEGGGATNDWCITPRLHYVPGGHVSGHRGRNVVTVRQRRGTVSTNVSRRDCRGRRGKFLNSQKICYGNHGADDLLLRT